MQILLLFSALLVVLVAAADFDLVALIVADTGNDKVDDAVGAIAVLMSVCVLIRSAFTFHIVLLRLCLQKDEKTIEKHCWCQKMLLVQHCLVIEGFKLA